MDRTVAKPGRPDEKKEDREGINNRAEDLGRESDRLIVAEKRVMIVERRGLTRNKQSKKGGNPLG